MAVSKLVEFEVESHGLPACTTIVIFPDAVVEYVETFSINLSSSDHAVIFTIASAFVYVLDNSSKPTCHIFCIILY